MDIINVHPGENSVKWRIRNRKSWVIYLELFYPEEE
jgi:hypothetical protein